MDAEGGAGLATLSLQRSARDMAKDKPCVCPSYPVITTGVMRARGGLRRMADSLGYGS